MGGDLGNVISSLLNTYTQCLKLLNRLVRKNGTASERGPRKLTRALRDARGKVSRIYSKGLARRGSSFKKGDAASRGSLKRVLRSLTATLSSFGVSFGQKEAKDVHPGVRLDYSSLISLSSSSQADAVRAMAELSSRISSKSSARSLAAWSNRSSKHSKQSKRSGFAARRQQMLDHRGGREARLAKAGPGKKDGSARIRDHSTHRGPEQQKRMSRITMSSASTKLGEVRGRRSDGEGSVAVYPRHSLEYGQWRPVAVDGERRKKWWHF